MYLNSCSLYNTSNIFKYFNGFISTFEVLLIIQKSKLLVEIFGQVGYDMFQHPIQKHI